MRVRWYRLQWRFWRRLHWIVSERLGFRLSGRVSMFCYHRFIDAADKFLPLTRRP